MITCFIIGFPEETREDLTQTLELHKQCWDIGVMASYVEPLIPEHGTEMNEEARRTIGASMARRAHAQVEEMCH